MDLLTVGEAKRHLSVEHNRDDGLIQIYCDAASSHLTGVNGILDNTLYTAWENRAAIPAEIRAAAMLLVANWYANREAVVIGETATALPLGVEALISPWKRRVIG